MPRALPQKLTRAHNEWWKAGKLNFRFSKAHTLEGNNAFELYTYGKRSYSHLKPCFFKKSAEVAISVFFGRVNWRKTKRSKVLKGELKIHFFDCQKNLRAISYSKQRAGESNIENQFVFRLSGTFLQLYLFTGMIIHSA